jgi:hypothetical protein
MFIAPECEACDFENLGYYVFGGVAVAIITGTIFAVLKYRSNKDSNPMGFVSIGGNVESQLNTEQK